MKRLLVILLLLATAASAQVFVQAGNNATSSTSATITLTLTFSANSTVIIVDTWGHDTLTTVTDACTVAGAPASSLHKFVVTGPPHSYIEWFAYDNVTGASKQISCTVSATPGFHDLYAMEFTGLSAVASLYDKVAEVHSSGTTYDSGNTAVVTQNKELLLCMVTGDTALTATNFTGPAGGAADGNRMQYRVVDAAPTAYNCTGSINSSYWITSLITAKAAMATTEQTHYRFRNDDGSETTATWAGAEDAAITEALATPRRLRVQADSVGDVASSAFQLEWMKAGGTDWRALGATTGTITVPIILGTDDAMQSGTTMTTTGTTLGASLDATTEWVGLRFQGVNVPKGATITSAYVSVVPSSTSEDEPLVTLYCEDADNSATFTTGASNLTNRSRTSSVAWSSTNLGATGTSYHDSPDLSTQVQAVIDRAGWAYGNPITVLIQGGATSTRDLTIKSYENTGATPAKLVIAWTYPTPAFVLSASANIAGSAVTPTTAQLTVPNAHSFTAGRISDDTNPLPALDPAASNYLEFEWAIVAQAPAADGDVYQFRVTVAGVPLTTYSVTPQWTIGGGAPPATRRKRVSGGWRW